MKKKLLSIFFVFLISVLSFSAKVNDVKFSANKFIINLNAADGECLVSADEESRLIYIEIQNLDSSSFEKFYFSYRDAPGLIFPFLLPLLSLPCVR